MFNYCRTVRTRTKKACYTIVRSLRLRLPHCVLNSAARGRLRWSLSLLIHFVAWRYPSFLHLNPRLRFKSDEKPLPPKAHRLPSPPPPLPLPRYIKAACGRQACAVNPDFPVLERWVDPHWNELRVLPGGSKLGGRLRYTTNAYSGSVRRR